MNKELLDKMAQARRIIFEIENKEIAMHQNKDHLSLMQKKCDKLIKESKISYIIKGYILWGFIAAGVGFWPALFIGGYAIPLLVVEYESESIISVLSIGYFFVLLIYTFIYVLCVVNQKRNCKKTMEQFKKTEQEVNKEIMSVIPWCREELKKIDFIPKEYQYGIAIDFFYKVLNNGRADSLKECMNLYEEQIHRWKLESNIASMKNVTNARTTAMERL